MSIEYKTQFSCGKCGKIFVPTQNYQIFCSTDCQSLYDDLMKSLEEKNLNVPCIDCGQLFRQRSESCGRLYCESCRYSRYKESNKRSYMNKPKKESESKKRNLPYSELIRRKEHDRVWKDSGWSHYLKGRKWDRI